MRSLTPVVLSAALLGIASSAMADRLISIPLGRKVPYKAVRIQHLFDGADRKEIRTSIGLGVTEAFDMEITYDDYRGYRDRLSFDLAYNLSEPLVGLAPGFSLGIRDALDETEEGRSFFLSGTFAEGGLGLYNQNAPVDATIGFLVDRKRTRPFVGVSVPFTDRFLLVAEHDSRRPIGGLELRPFAGASVRWLHQPEKSMWQIGFQQRF